MKKAFTLIELMISILLLSLIVTFLYHSMAQLQNSNVQFIKKTAENTLTDNSVKLIYNDFLNAISVQWKQKESDVDVIVLQTSHSLHGLSFPYVQYRVYKDDNTLRRIESPVEKIDFLQKLFHFNTIINKVERFKVYVQKGHYLIYLKAEGIRDIVLDLVPPAVSGTQALNPNGSSDSNNTQADGNGTKEGEN